VVVPFMSLKRMAEFLDACLAWQTPELVVHASLGMLIDEPFSFDLTVCPGRAHCVYRERNAGEWKIHWGFGKRCKPSPRRGDPG